MRKLLASQLPTIEIVGFLAGVSMISNKEAIDILISVLVVSLALSIAQFGFGIFTNLEKLFFIISFFAVTVGTGFVLHELAHKFVAIAFGCKAEFKMWNVGIVLALLSSFFGFVFIAPGAVYIYSRYIDKMQNAIISLAGPLTNLALAFVFIGAGIFFPLSIGTGNISVWLFASKINIWIGMFNMLPIFPLDGSKIMEWNLFVWAFFTGIFFFFFIL